MPLSAANLHLCARNSIAKLERLSLKTQLYAPGLTLLVGGMTRIPSQYHCECARSMFVEGLIYHQ